VWKPHDHCQAVPAPIPLRSRRVGQIWLLSAPLPNYAKALALAARTRDIDDLRLLAGMIGVETADAALQICADFYPDEPIPARTDAVLRELFG
jgi:hypothetical protein